MTTNNFTTHNGGKCPVADGTLVVVKYRNGKIQPQNVAINWNWEHILGDYDITHWRLAEQSKQENEPVGYYKKDALYAADKFKEVCQVQHSGQYLDYVPVFTIPPDSAAIIAKLEAIQLALSNLEALVSPSPHSDDGEGVISE